MIIVIDIGSASLPLFHRNQHPTQRRASGAEEQIKNVEVRTCGFSGLEAVLETPGILPKKLTGGPRK